MDVVDEAASAVDLEDGDPLAVRRLQHRIAVDRDLPQLEAQLVVCRADDPAGRRAQVAARRRVEDDLGYG
jgi:hypothetical protein